MASKKSIVSLRRTLDLTPLQLLTLVVGVWLVLSIFGLYDPIVQLTGTNTVWAYFIVIVVMLPAVLNHIELRDRLNVEGYSSFNLITAIGHNILTFYAGWFYLFGWLALSGLFALTMGEMVASLLAIDVLLGINVDPRLIALVALLIVTVISLIQYRPSLRLSTRVMVAALGAIVLVIVSLLVQGLETQIIVFGSRTGEDRFFRGLLTAVAAMWVVEVLGRSRNRERQPIATRILQMALPAGLAGLFAFSASFFNPRMLMLLDLMENATPSGYVMAFFIGFGLILVLFAWLTISLVMLREAQLLGSDGVLPPWLLQSTARQGMPYWLIIIHALLTVFTIVPGRIDLLAQLAAVAFLLLEIGVSVAAIVVISKNNDKEAEEEGEQDDKTFTLPFFPLFPALAIGASFLLSLALLPALLAVLAFWILVGGGFYIQGARSRIRQHQVGVTVFQDMYTRENLTSGYAVIAPINDFERDTGVLSLAAILARENDGHVTVLQVVEVPESQSLDSGTIEARQTLRELEDRLQKVEEYGVPVEGVVRLSHSASQSIIDTANEGSAKVIVLGWDNARGKKARSNRRGVLEEVMDGATADIVMLNRPIDGEIERVMVSVSGGSHAPKAARLGLSLTKSTDGEVTLLTVVRDPDDEVAVREAEENLVSLQRRLQERSIENREGLLQDIGQQVNSNRIKTKLIKSSAPIASVIAEEGDGYDLVMMGTSEIGILEQRAIGPFQRQLANQCNTPIVIMRAHTGLGTVVARRTFNTVADMLPSLNSRETRDLFQRMRDAAQPNINYFVLITLSAIIATLGLLLNSPAVVIGAMLVAPLMSPIIAVSVGITFGDIKLLRNALTATIQGTVAAIFVGTLIALIVPGDLLTNEVLSRTQPTLVDLMVAVFSGMAGAYAIARREVGEALPGVAIAAALVPPLGTVGVGLALGNPGVAFGALILFTTNFVAITFAASLVFLLLGIRPPQRADRQRQLLQGLAATIVALLIISIPLGLFLFNGLRQDQLEAQALAMINSRIAEWNEDAELIDFNVEFQTGFPFRQVMVIQGTLYTTDTAIDYDVVDLQTDLQDELAPDVSLDLYAVPVKRLDASAVEETTADADE